MPDEQKDNAKSVTQRISIRIPSDVPVVYTNVILVSNTPSEVVLDLAQVLPRTSEALVKSRVIMTPAQAKILHTQLAKTVQMYEKQFGEIQVQNPQQEANNTNTIADQFFRFPKDDEDSSEGDQ